MEKDLKQQGIYDDMIKQMENNHYYLVAVDDSHYIFPLSVVFTSKL